MCNTFSVSEKFSWGCLLKEIRPVLRTYVSSLSLLVVCLIFLNKMFSSLFSLVIILRYKYTQFNFL